MQMHNGRSNHPEEGSPSFFKVIRYPSTSHLVLPNAFVRKYFKKIPKKPTIVTETREHSWRMEFVKIGEDYCFAHGWQKLVKDVQLCLRDIVVFWLIDSLTFKVTFLRSNGCEKDFPFDKTNDDDDDDDDDDDVNDNGEDGGNVGGWCDDGECHNVDDDDHHHHEVMSDNNLWFQKVFSGKTYKSFMTLPVKFIRAAGLEYTKSIKLKDHEGKVWTIGILAERYTRNRYSLSAGWTRFRRYHRISEGDVGTFTFNKNEGVFNFSLTVNRKRNVKNEVDWWPTKRSCGGGDGGGGGGKVKIEYESGFADVKIEDDLEPEMVVGAGKSGMRSPEKGIGGGGVAVVEAEQREESVFRTKNVIYF